MKLALTKKMVGSIYLLRSNIKKPRSNFSKRPKPKYNEIGYGYGGRGGERGEV